MKLVKIVATIGPASTELEVLEKMIAKGMNVARINMKHGTHKEHQEKINNIREISSHIPIMIDINGPSLRVGNINNIELQKGEVMELPKNFFNHEPPHVEIGDTIYVEDGTIELKVVSTNPLTVKAATEGTIKKNKNINIPGEDINTTYLSKKDYKDLKFAADNDAEIIAASFVNKKQDLDELREYMSQIGLDAYIISKIESQYGIDNLNEIIQNSDGVMVARGDLGVEIPIEYIPSVQRRIIEGCKNNSKPVIVATQMLNTMIEHPHPTRAEITDIATAVHHGADAVMLSGETATGKHPIKAVDIMGRVIRAEQYEQHIDHIQTTENIYDIIAKNAVRIAEQSKSKAIVTLTVHGSTIFRLARYRPRMPIIAFTENDKLHRQLNLVYGTIARKITFEKSAQKTLINAIAKCKNEQILNDGDPITVVVGSWSGVPGTTEGIAYGIVGREY